MGGPKGWGGHRIKARAPNNSILLGAKGSAGEAILDNLVDEVIANDYRGIMVWSVSIEDFLVYHPAWDGSNPANQESFIHAMKRLNPLNT